MRLIDTGEALKAGAPEQVSWAIKGVAGGLTVLWGEPKNGKSFVALSMALAVATGKPWFGNPVRQGAVIYVAAEGGWAGFANRLMALCDHSEVPLGDLTGRLIVVDHAVDLGKTEAFEAQLEEWDRIEPGLVVVDTLSRCMSGDENKQEAMQGFVASTGLITARYGASVLVVHHSNREGTIRGSNVLAGAVDSMIKVTKGVDGGKNPTVFLTANMLKELDTEHFEPQRLYPTVVDVRDCWGENVVDDFGDKQTTLVLDANRKEMVEREQLTLALLVRLAAGRPEAQAIGMKELREAAIEAGLEVHTLKRALAGLVGQGVVSHPRTGHYYVGDPPDQEDFVPGKSYELLDSHTRAVLEHDARLEIEQDAYETSLGLHDEE